MPPGKFHFKQFSIADDRCAMKVGTDGVLLGAWCDVDSASNILDIGSGSGLIALMLAQRNPEASITAVEIDKNAASQAAENVKNSPWQSRIDVIHAAVQDMLPDHKKEFDLIVCNPPFFAASRSTIAAGDHRRLARNDEQLPLGELFSVASELLTGHGKMSVVIPVNRKDEITEIAHQNDLHPSRITYVIPKTGKDCHRILMSFCLIASSLQEDELILQKSEKRNDFTEDYIGLTKDFHTIF
ncbi:MAG: methyltransferase [Bacteroidetes bacterium]|nr:methyltransferase [Bacteroidota bacterium]